jgi:hypothetical protein
LVRGIKKKHRCGIGRAIDRSLPAQPNTMPLLQTVLSPFAEVLLHVPKGLGAKAAEVIVLPMWFERVANRQAPRQWRGAFEEAMRRTPELHGVSADFCLAPGFLRLLVNSFRPDRQHGFPDARLMALTLAFELWIQRQQTDPVVVRKFAGNLYLAWCRVLNRHAALKWYLKDVRDIHPVELMKDHSCTPELDAVLSDPVKLAEAFLSSYSQLNGADEVTVWLPNSEGDVSYDAKTARPVVVAMLSANGAEFGFFRDRFDYSLSRKGTRLWLRAAFENTSELTETASFQGYALGDVSGRALWLL